MATHSSILAWKIEWTDEAGGLQSIGPQKVRHDWSHWARAQVPYYCKFPSSDCFLLHALSFYMISSIFICLKLFFWLPLLPYWLFRSEFLNFHIFMNFLFFLIFILSSIQSLSHVQPFVTPWTAACQASLSITNSKSLLKLMSIESVMPSNHLILCRPLLPPSVIPSHQGLFKWVSSLHQVAKVLELQLQHQSF